MFLGTLAIALLLLAVPLGVEAQQAGKVHRIGFLSGGSPSAARTSSLVEAFRDGLRELGYVEGRNITIEWRFSQGRGEHFPTLANELSQVKVEAIVATGGPATRAAKQATSTIPIVMAFTTLVLRGCGCAFRSRDRTSDRRAHRDSRGTVGSAGGSHNRLPARGTGRLSRGYRVPTVPILGES